MLIFTVELLIQRRKFSADGIDLCVVKPGNGTTQNEIDFIRKVAGVFADYGRVFLTDNIRELPHILIDLPDRYMVYPDFTTDLEYQYGTTLIIQQSFKETGLIPYLSVNSESKCWAAHFLAKHCRNLAPITVHLKHVSDNLEESNADLTVWSEFLARIHEERYPVKFILVGPDPLIPEINAAPNVIRSRNYNVTLGYDLALIQHSAAFMGMASGPSIMAVFNRNPYTIFKHPHHHRLEMEKELRGKDRYPFALDCQKMIYDYQSLEKLLTCFKQIYNCIV
jgi:hypothetical protein